MKVYNRRTMIDLLENRPPGVALITVSNHDSCMDEPLLWGFLDLRHLLNQCIMRWVPAAHNICFTRKFHSQFFALGKSIPVVRGDGVYQEGVQFSIDRLNEGHWLHVYPEGKVNMYKKDLRFKWGVGRMIAECKKVPIVLPVYHVGMDDVLPTKKPYIPRLGQQVTVVIGDPVPVGDAIKSLKERGASEEEQRKTLTDLVEFHVKRLKKTAEILHAKRKTVLG